MHKDLDNWMYNRIFSMVLFWGIGRMCKTDDIAGMQQIEISQEQASNKEVTSDNI